MRAQRLLGGAIVNQPAQFVADHQQFVYAGAAAITRAIAHGAALRRVKGSVSRGEAERAQLRRIGDEGLAAFHAQPAHQALRHHADQAGGEQERLDAHVHQPRDRADCIVGMQRGEYEMSGKARLDRDLRRFEIADLADHDHIRVLAQDGPQRQCEAHLDPRIDLGLADAVEVVFDGILDGHDVQRGGVEPRERGIKRGGLARSGGTRHQDDAVWLDDEPVHLRKRGVVHAQAREIQPPGLLVEQAQHRSFPVPGGNRRHAHVHRLAGNAQRDAAILRQAFFRDVELRHDFHARNDRPVQGACQFDQVAQRAVDAQAHHRARFKRLDVDVGGAVAQGLREQGIDQPDHRRVVLAFEQILDPGDFLQQSGQIHVLRQVAGQRRRAGIGAVVGHRDQLVELPGVDAAGVQRHAQCAAQFGQRARTRIVAHRHLRQIIIHGRDDDAVGLGKRVGNFDRGPVHQLRPPSR